MMMVYVIFSSLSFFFSFAYSLHTCTHYSISLSLAYSISLFLLNNNILLLTYLVYIFIFPKYYVELCNDVSHKKLIRVSLWRPLYERKHRAFNIKIYILQNLSLHIFFHRLSHSRFIIFDFSQQIFFVMFLKFTLSKFEFLKNVLKFKFERTNFHAKNAH